MAQLASSGSAGQSKKTQSSSNNNNKSNNKPSSSLEEQVIRAEQAVYKNQATSEALHKQWKTQLLHMSLLLAVIGVHQWQSHVTPCVQEIKHFNQNQEVSLSSLRIGAIEAIQIVVRDSMEYAVALVMTTCVIFFLTSQQQPKNGSSSFPARVDFSSSWPYMLANACIPVVLSLYFQRRKSLAAESASSATYYCLTEFLAHHHLRPTLRNLDSDASTRTPSFPVVIVFHLIVTASFWFMDTQAVQHQHNVEKVEKLRRDLTNRIQDNNNNAAATSKDGNVKRPNTKSPSGPSSAPTKDKKNS